MMVLPLQISETEYSTVVILEDENIERIKQHDPAEVHTKLLIDQFSSRELKSVMIAYVSPSEKDELVTFLKQGDLSKALTMLSRGFQFRPDKGDNDNPYERVKT